MSENLSVRSLLEKTGQWMHTVDGNEETQGFLLQLFIVCVSTCVCACAHIYSIQRSKDNLQELVISFYHVDPGNKMQIVRPGSKYLYVPSHPARLKESRVSERGFQTHSVADSEGLALGKCYCDKYLYKLLQGGIKGQMTWGKALHALANRFIFYSVKTDEFGSGAKER